MIAATILGALLMTEPDASWGKEANGLQTRIQAASETFKPGGPVELIFEVRNTSAKPIEFCWWQCPLEGRFTADRFDIEGPAGKVAYAGMMVKRRPPSKAAGDYVTCRPGWTLSARFNLADGYKDLDKAGKYVIRFSGTTVGSLPKSNSLTLSIRD